MRKRFSKVIALILTFALFMASGVNIVSAESTVSVTVDGETLGQEIDIAQKDISINFGQAVDENTLAENISLSTVERGNVMHLTRTGTEGDDYSKFSWAPEAPITSGVVKVKFAFKSTIDATNTRYARIYMYALNDSQQSKQIGRLTFSGSNLIVNSSTLSNKFNPSTANRWCEAEVTIDVSNSKYSLKVDGNDIHSNVDFTDVNNRLDSLAFGMSGSNTGFDISYKDIEISHISATGADPYTYNTDFSDAQEGSRPDCFDYTGIPDDEALGIDCKIENVILEKTPVATVSGAYDSANYIYTLSNSGSWDVSKEYVLDIGTGITDGTNPVMDTPIEKSFVVRNLFGEAFTVESIKTSSGKTITNGGYMPASDRGINVSFSDEVNESTLSGIKLEKQSTERVFRTKLPRNTVAYGRNWLTCDLTDFEKATNEGIYTFTTDIIVDTAGYENDLYAVKPTLSFYNSQGKEILAFYANSNLVYCSTASPTQNKDVFLPKSEWRKLEIVIDASNDKLSIYATNPTNGQKDTYVDKKPFKTDQDGGSKVTSFNFGVYNRSESVTASEGDISYKNFKMTYTDTNNVTSTLFDIDTDTAQLADIYRYFSDWEHASNAVGTKYFDNEYKSPAQSVEYDTAYDPTTYTVSILPTAAFEYLGKYSLTVPTTVLSGDGKELMEETVIDFTSVFHDALYCAAAGFTANEANLVEISDTFTGDITGWADITNYGSSPQNAVVYVALYLNNKLVDVDLAEAEGIGGGLTRNNVSATVTVPSDKAGPGYSAAIFVWDNEDDIRPIMVKKSIE